MSANPLLVKAKADSPWVSDPSRRKAHDYYVTPQPLVDFALGEYWCGRDINILDIGAADGRWGRAALWWSEGTEDSWLTGVDIRPIPQPPEFHFWHPNLDYTRPIDRAMMAIQEFHFIVSNPPFSKAEEIIRAAWQQLAPGGSMLFLLPLSFLASSGRGQGLWQEIPPVEVGILAQRVNYENAGDSNPRDDALYYWRKDSAGQPVGTPGRLPARILNWR